MAEAVQGPVNRAGPATTYEALGSVLRHRRVLEPELSARGNANA
ncbi:MAG: hypothetical protein PVF90_01195 [Gemmatimonadota bacterium]|jgi:hypothetical protein